MESSEPSPPQGVVVRLKDGREIKDPPVVYVGQSSGLHVWEVCLDVRGPELMGAQLHVDVLPAMTSIQLGLGGARFYWE